MDLEELREICEKTIPIAKVNIRTMKGPGGPTYEVVFETQVLNKNFEWERIGLLTMFTQGDLKDKKMLIELQLKRIVETYAHSRNRISGMAVAKKDYGDMLAAVYGDKELHALYQQFGKIH